jgi:hypothetical protein|tara:strand:+ start:7230 stop:7520 length:291 start_codon:yes stop_codon:yes gene_type:complete
MLMVAMRDFGFDCLGCPDVIKESYVIRKQYRDFKLHRDTIKERHSKFAKEYNNLFDMITSDHCNDIILERLLNIASDCQKKSNGPQNKSKIPKLKL